MPRYYLAVDVPDVLDRAFHDGCTGLTAGLDGNPVHQAQQAINAVLPALESGDHVKVSSPLVGVNLAHGSVLAPQGIDPERAGFLADVLSTAVEGGINDWCQIESWNNERTHGRTEVQVVELAECDNPRADYGWDLPRRVGLDDLERGFGLLTDGGTDQYMAADYSASIVQASRDSDAGDIDAYDASLVFQLALFGKVIYG